MGEKEKRRKRREERRCLFEYVSEASSRWMESQAGLGQPGEPRLEGNVWQARGPWGRLRVSSRDLSDRFLVEVRPLFQAAFQWRTGAFLVTQTTVQNRIQPDAAGSRWVTASAQQEANLSQSSGGRTSGLLTSSTQSVVGMQPRPNTAVSKQSAMNGCHSGNRPMDHAQFNMVPRPRQLLG